MHPAASVVVLTLVASTAVVAQESSPAKEPTPRNAKKGDFARFPLGCIGGQGEVLAGMSTITVLSVREGGPGARAGLAKGDQVTAAGGRTFPVHTRDINELNGPMLALGNAIEAAERTGNALLLTGLREGNELSLTIDLGHPGKLEFAGGTTSAKALAFYDGVCEDLLRTRRKNGSWQSATGEDASRYVTALCGLALLGRGTASHRPALDTVAAYLAGPDRRGHVSEDLKKPAGLSNWFITMSGIYLAEHALATGDTQWLPTLQHLCDCLAARQTPEGRYGHGITVGYGGKGFNVINTHAHLLWALAERAGCKIDDTAWDRSFAEIEKSTGKNGGVRYWTLQTGYWDACARTGQMALALILRDEAPELRDRMGGYLDKHSSRMREAHAMSSIGMIFGSAALRSMDEEAFARHADAWSWYLNLMRQPDNSAGYIGGKRNNGGDSYLRKEHVANAIAGNLLACSLGHLHICGNQERSWFPE